MAIGFHGAFITIDSTWLPFKAQVVNKSLSIQYYDDGDRYVIYALDDNVILYLTFIYKNTVPDTIVVAGYSQSQNDSDKSDFVSNFASSANTTVGGIFPDKSSFTYGIGTASTIGGVYQDTAPSLTSGQLGAVRLTANRSLHVNLRDASGNEKLGQLTMANSIPIAIASDQSSFTVGATQSGTWTVQPGNTANTTPWLVTDSSDGTVGAGTAASKSSLAGLVYNTSLPTLTNGQQAAAQADAYGRLLVGSIASALPTGTNHIGSQDIDLLKGIADPGNSSTATLGAGGVFTGATFDALHYSAFLVAVKSDVASATNGLVFEWSTDGTNWDLSTATSVPAAAGRGSPLTHRGRYFRVVYTNGAGAQSYFRLTTIHRPAMVGLAPKSLADTVDDQNFALVVRAIISARTPSGTYVSASFDDEGRLITAPTGANASVSGFSLGTVTTTAVTAVPIRSTTYNEQAANAQRSISSANANDTSAGTGARTVKITYYDNTGAGPSTETITMNGTTPVNTVSSTICYIEEMEVITSGSGGTNAGIITLFVSTAGGGGTIGTMAAGDAKTLWCHHYTPTGKSTYVTGVSGHNNNSSNGTILTVRAKPLSANSTETIVSDFLRVGGGTAQVVRGYGTPIEVIGPARIILYGAPEGTPNIITRGSFDFYDQ